MPSLVGNTVDKYEVLEEIGHGGMAVVYRAVDRTLEREVAFKVLHPHLADRPESRLRLRREALAVAKLRHDNILEIFDYSGEDSEDAYIVTEFIRGPTLRKWLDEGRPLRPAIAALIAYHLAQAVAHAHRAGIVHRDIKPENVMVRAEDGCIKLMDFGIAQILDHQKLTVTGQLLGSPAYMAPELISGRPVDARTDLFSLGVLLYQLATGRLPFAGRNPHEVLARIADGDYPPPSQVDARVDSELEAIIAHALSVEPSQRYQTADALAADLRAYLLDMGIDPDATPLRPYFENPDAFVAELDERVARHLYETAQERAKAGEHARAIHLVARALEIAPDSPEARTLFDRLCRRRTARRAAIYAGAGLVVSALVASAAWAIHLRTKPSAPGTVPPAPAANSGRFEGTVRDGDPSVEVRRGKAGTDRDNGPAPASSAPSTPPPSPGTEAGLENRRRAQPRHVAAYAATCQLRLEGIGTSHARNLRIRVGDQPWRPVPGTTLRIPIRGKGPIPVQIRGARFGYSGTLDPTRCRKGPVPIGVRPHPATLEFPDAPPDAVVYCLRCPEGVGRGPFTPDRFPIVQQVPASGVPVQLEYKHPDYLTRRDSFVLLPGPNRRSMQLRPR